MCQLCRYAPNLACAKMLACSQCDALGLQVRGPAKQHLRIDLQTFGAAAAFMTRVHCTALPSRKSCCVCRSLSSPAANASKPMAILNILVPTDT